MKRLFISLLCISLLLCGCESTQSSEQTPTSSPSPTEIAAPTVSPSPAASETPSNTTSTTTPIISFESVAEPFRSILEDKQTFFSATSKGNIKISSYYRNLWQYATIDFDDDGTDEFALMFQDGDVLILRKNGDSVVGFDFGVHAMYQINKDGTFCWNSNAGNTYGCSRLQFSDNQCKSIELFHIEHSENNLITYFVAGVAVSESVFRNAEAKVNTESVEWITLK